MGKSLQEEIREHYARHAAGARRGKGSCGCSGEAFGSRLYSQNQLSALSAEVRQASAGCGNPTALADLRPGETVLDLGSGGGIDAFLAARQVGPDGKVIGVDMTPEMLGIAQGNAARMGIGNVEFLQGEIEHLPLPDASVDVILSNCVINLSQDKDQVFREAWRVLKPGGRLAISDMMFVGDLASLPQSVRDSANAWADCVSGALEADDYRNKVEQAGFSDVSLQVTSEYDLVALSAGSCCGASSGSCCGSKPEGASNGSSATPSSLGVKLVSGFLRATKPGLPQ